MSGYGHQMEREYSSQSLPSRGESEVGSHYTEESGFYMSSFAAAVFIAALMIVGISLFTILITLTVMLQSCQSQNEGIVKIWKSSDDYGYCRILALHAELNNLDAYPFPASCLFVSVQYIKEGQYRKDLNASVWMAENYLTSVKPLDDGLHVVLMDVDDFFYLDSHDTDVLLSQFKKFGCNDCIQRAKLLKRIFFQKLYMKVQASGFPLILFSRNPERLRNATMEYLGSSGISHWASLILRLDDEMQMGSQEYFSRRRISIQEKGFKILAVISSQMDALTGSGLGRRIFKLPSPFLLRFKSTISKEYM